MAVATVEKCMFCGAVEDGLAQFVKDWGESAGCGPGKWTSRITYCERKECVAKALKIQKK